MLRKSGQFFAQFVKVELKLSDNYILLFLVIKS